MACDGVGPSQTCLNILTGAHRARYPVDLFANRARAASPEFPAHLAVPRLFSFAPYKHVAGPASRRIEKSFVEDLDDTDVAYVWPAASLEVHRRLNAEGVPVILEGINTRMLSAKRILDDAYSELGLPPLHRITQQGIDVEEAKYEYATGIFAPNRSVEQALAGSPLEDRFIPASYGVDTSRASPPRSYETEGPLTFMFCGYACVRKGVHYLLEAWSRMPQGHKLQFVGDIEPAIAERYAAVLARDDVETTGFVKDVHPYFAQADVFVFPSLEEGGPQVTYEAALHGLPIIASQAGASRLGDTEGTIAIVDPGDTTAFLATLESMANAPGLRESLGTAARAAVTAYDWDRVGQDRARNLMERLPSLTAS